MTDKRDTQKEIQKVEIKSYWFPEMEKKAANEAFLAHSLLVSTQFILNESKEYELPWQKSTDELDPLERLVKHIRVNGPSRSIIGDVVYGWAGVDGSKEKKVVRFDGVVKIAEQMSEEMNERMSDEKARKLADFLISWDLPNLIPVLIPDRSKLSLETRLRIAKKLSIYKELREIAREAQENGPKKLLSDVVRKMYENGMDISVIRTAQPLPAASAYILNSLYRLAGKDPEQGLGGYVDRDNPRPDKFEAIVREPTDW